MKSRIEAAKLKEPAIGINAIQPMLCPQTDVLANKMLQVVRMSAMTGRTAAS